MNVVILAGGSGTRFWPLSRTARPKQLISITGDRSMLQKTVDRILPLKPKRILVVTNHLQALETERQLQSCGSIPVEVIAEPVGRNTAAAIGLAAALVAAVDPSGVMAVLPADHFIRNEAAFRDALLFAAGVASERHLVTLGIPPSRPETGYGYIEAGCAVSADGCFPVTRFIEKPPLEDAVRYLEGGTYYWNSGMFVWRADTILEEMEAFLPVMRKRLAPLLLAADASATGTLNGLIAEIYRDIENISIDYGVMEKSSRVKMVPVEIGWSDVGSWSALPEILDPDNLGNICVNAVGHIAVDSTDCLVYADRKVVATVGVHNLVIVSTPDAVLVCDRERCQDVKKVVERLGAAGLVSCL